MKIIAALGSILTLASLALAAPARAEARDATEAEVAFFVGLWAVGAADAPGFETMAGRPDCTLTTVFIERAGASAVRRITTMRNSVQRAVEFDVKSFGGNFPFWIKNGVGGPVARRVDADTFLLATLRDGRADWQGALKHVRCK